ncbi:MAG TPA: M28 family metallopeptidase [Thermoleophilaceae bacterium]
MRQLALSLAAAAATAALVACADSPGAAGKPRVDHFDSHAAWRLLKSQVALGPRPAGSPASRRLARKLKRLLPHGRYQAVPGGLRNVVGRVPGRGRGYLVVGAHYDTKDLPDFVGANDGASGTAVVTQLARTIKPHRLRRTVVFVLFDGEESPAGTPDDEFEAKGLRGSRVAARRYREARSMVLLDFVGNRHLRIPREEFSSFPLWSKLRRAARRVGAGPAFPPQASGGVLDDQIPFAHRGVRSIDLIDFDFDCWHRTCDDLGAVSERSLELVGETMLRYLASL